jgi:hypothetical protein
VKQVIRNAIIQSGNLVFSSDLNTDTEQFAYLYLKSGLRSYRQYSYFITLSRITMILLAWGSLVVFMPNQDGLATYIYPIILAYVSLDIMLAYFEIEKGKSAIREAEEAVKAEKAVAAPKSTVTW